MPCNYLTRLLARDCRTRFSDNLKRRLVRLHPMVVIGSVIGALFFYFGDSTLFEGIDRTPVATLLLSTVFGSS